MKKEKYRVAVIGATGSVGRELLNSLSERKFPISEIIPSASEKSSGKQVSFGDDNIKVVEVSKLDFSEIDIAFFCAGSEISRKYASEAVLNKCIVIDKSSCFRLDEKVPLIVPEVNIDKLKDFKTGIISSPNCCTIPLAVALKPLDNASKIKRLVISTYQSASGAGKYAMDELYYQTKAKFIFEDLNPEVFPKQIAFNLFPHIGDFKENGYTEEEYKIQEELKKIIGDRVNPTVTCVRVPVFVSHCMSVNIEFEDKLDAKDAEEILYESDSIIVYSQGNEIKYSTPVESVENDEVFVSRIRNDFSNKNSINMWVSCDNLRKGAALNAVQIAEKCIGK